MQDVKRVEIVINSLEVPRLLRLLERHGITGYTIVHRVTGSGDRGWQDGEGLTEAFTNVYVLIFCAEANWLAAREDIRKTLVKVGGVCGVCDAQWLTHW